MKALAAALFAIAVATPAAAQQPVKLKFASFEPPQAPITGKVFTPWAQDVSNASNGTLEIEMFPGGQLGRNPLQQLKLVEDGIADLTWTVPGYTPGRFDDVEVTELPFLVRTAREGSLALTRMNQRGQLAGFGELKLLFLGTVPANNIHSTFPVASVADLKGKRIRTGSAQLAKLVESLGAAPVQLGAPQVAESLSKGVIDGSLNEWNFVATFKIDQVASHHFALPMGTLAVMVPMLKSKFDALPPAAKAALDRYSGEALAVRFFEVVDGVNDATRERVAKSAKNKIVVPSAADEDQWRKATQALADTWRKSRPRNEAVYTAFTQEVAAVRAGK
jgi:TRAP-type C4-dicarboxylate transport system substrate-binding protein